MKVVITGGCGFIGSRLAKRGIEEGWDVLVYDNFSRFGPDNLGHTVESISVIRGDIEDLESLRAVVKGSDIVFHLAGISRAVGSVDDPQGFFKTNTVGTHNVFESCRGTLTRVVFASSWVVYERETKKGAKTSEGDELDPATPYALSKFVGEKYGEMYANLYGQDNISLRFSNVYGPGDKDRVIPTMITRALKGLTVRVNGNPHFVDFIYIDDLVEALVSVGNVKRLSHRAYNIGTSQSVNLIDLARLIIRECQSSSGVQVGQLPNHEHAYYCPDISLAREELGFVAHTTLEEGIRMCVKSVQKTQEANDHSALQSLQEQQVT